MKIALDEEIASGQYMWLPEGHGIILAPLLTSSLCSLYLQHAEDWYVRNLGECKPKRHRSWRFLPRLGRSRI